MLSLAGLMLLANVPLFFALASLTRATLLDAREQSARALGRAVAAHVADVRASHDSAALKRVLESHVGQGGVEALCVYDRSGAVEASAGDAAELAQMHAPRVPFGEGMATVHGASGRALEIVVPRDDAAVVARLRTDEDADRAAPLVRLVALYVSTFALALLIFAYFSLTRLIVRPVEALVRAADKVASGAPALDVPRAGARELADLGASVGAMTSRLLADEEKLRTKVEELTRTTKRLTEAQSQLARSERMASVGRLAAGIGHEIGNPIAAIMGMQELLLDGDLPPETPRDFVERMKKETERIHTILRDLLDFARPEQPTSEASPPEPANVGEVLGDVLALVAPQKGFHQIKLERETTDEGLCVALPSSRLTQVLLNIVLNAGDAIGKDGGRIVLRVRRDDPASLSLSGRREVLPNNIRIEIEDDGPGIAPAVRDRLFEPFVTTKDVGAGTGLGLAVCRGLIEAAGGQIFVEPADPSGARFIVLLPEA